MLRTVGDAFFEVLRAEMAVLAERFKAAGFLAAGALALVGGVFFSIFWLLGLMVLAMVDLVRQTQEWQLWQAALLVAGLLFLLMVLALVVAWLLVRRLESPLHTAQERMNDHLRWWQDHVLEDPAHRLNAASDERSKR